MKMIFFLPEKLKVGKISITWLLSKIWKGGDLTVGVQIDKFSWSTAC